MAEHAPTAARSARDRQVLVNRMEWGGPVLTGGGEVAIC